MNQTATSINSNPQASDSRGRRKSDAGNFFRSTRRGLPSRVSGLAFPRSHGDRTESGLRLLLQARKYDESARCKLGISRQGVFDSYLADQQTWFTRSRG